MTPEQQPCGYPSRGGRMQCELPKGHDPVVVMTEPYEDGGLVGRRWHRSHAADGSKRCWYEIFSELP